MQALEILKKKWKNANETWERLSREFVRREIIYSGGRRIVYLPQGSKHFPIDDGEKKVVGYSTPRIVWAMAKEGLVKPDDEILVMFTRAPILEGVVSTLDKASKVRLWDLENNVEAFPFE